MGYLNKKGKMGTITTTIIIVLLVGIFSSSLYSFASGIFGNYGLIVDSETNETMFNMTLFALDKTANLTTDIQGSVESKEGVTDLEKKFDVFGTLWTVVKIPFSLLENIHVLLVLSAGLIGMPSSLVYAVEAIIIIIVTMGIISIYFGKEGI